MFLQSPLQTAAGPLAQGNNVVDEGDNEQTRVLNVPD